MRLPNWKKNHNVYNHIVGIQDIVLAGSFPINDRNNMIFEPGYAHKIDEICLTLEWIRARRGLRVLYADGNVRIHKAAIPAQPYLYVHYFTHIRRIKRYCFFMKKLDLQRRFQKRTAEIALLWKKKNTQCVPVCLAKKWFQWRYWTKKQTGWELSTCIRQMSLDYVFRRRTNIIYLKAIFFNESAIFMRLNSIG